MDIAGSGRSSKQKKNENDAIALRKLAALEWERKMVHDLRNGELELLGEKAAETAFSARATA